MSSQPHHSSIHDPIRRTKIVATLGPASDCLLLDDGRVVLDVTAVEGREVHTTAGRVAKVLLRLAALWNIPVACNAASADFLISSPWLESAYEMTIPDGGAWVSTRNAD